MAALIILALAHPLLNPQGALPGDGPLALVIDDGWAAARDWTRRQTAATDILAEADRENRPVVLVTTAPLASGEAPPPLAPVRASDARAAVQALQPKPWPADRKAALDRLAGDAAAAGHRERVDQRRGRARSAGSGQTDEGDAAALAAFLDGRGTLRYVAAERGRCAAPAAARMRSPGEQSAKEFGVVVQLAAGARCRAR